MAARAKTRDEDLYKLCDAIAAEEGQVRISHLRTAAGGGSYARLKTIVEAWEERRRHASPAAAPAASLDAQETGAAEPADFWTEGSRADRSERDLAVENARLEARIAELVRENDRLWEHLAEERATRVREVERLNQLIEALHRQTVADRRAIREDYSAALAKLRPA